MPAISATDPDFRVCQISMHVLLEVQAEAEALGLSARWSSIDALRSQVKEGIMWLHPIMREERGGGVRAYRCLLMFRMLDGSGGVATVDVAPGRFESLERLDRDLDVRLAFSGILSLVSGGVAMVSKG